MEYCCHVWVGAPSCYLQLFNNLQKRICKTVGPSLAASLEPLAHRQNVASLSLFYRHNFARCSSELAQLVPLPYYRGRSTCYSDTSYDFSVPIPRCWRDVYDKFFSSHSSTLEFSAYRMLSFDLWSKKSRINRHLLSAGSF